MYILILIRNIRFWTKPPPLIQNLFFGLLLFGGRFQLAKIGARGRVSKIFQWYTDFPLPLPA